MSSFKSFCFLLIKLWTTNRNLLARSVIPIKNLNLGYRVLDLYDNLCSKIEGSFLIIKTNKILNN